MKHHSDGKTINIQDWQLFIDNLSEEVLIVDANYYVILANLAARESFGHDIVEPYQYTFEDFYYGLWNQADDCPLREAVKKRKSTTKTFTTGTETCYKITAKPIINSQNSIEWIICTGKYVNSDFQTNKEPTNFKYTGEWSIELNNKIEVIQSNQYMGIFTGIDNAQLADAPIQILPLLAPEFRKIFERNFNSVVNGRKEIKFRVLFQKNNNSFYGGYVILHERTSESPLIVQATIKPFRNFEVGSEKYFEHLRLQNYISIIANQMAQSKTFAQGYRNVVESISEVLKLDLCGFLHVDPQKNIEVRAAHLNGKFYDRSTTKSIDLEHITTFLNDIENYGFLHFNDVSKTKKSYNTLLQKQNIHSFISIPLIYRERMTGIVILGYKHKSHWPEYKIDFANTIGSIVLQSFIQEEIREKLKRANEGFVNIFENSSDAVFIVALNGFILEVNRTAETLTGYSKKELQKKKVSNISKAENLDIAQMPFEMMQSHQMIFGTELLHRNGEAIPVETREKIIRYNDNLSILVIARDVRHRRELNKLMVQTIANTEEKERKRIAEGLHDDIGPLLSTLRIYIDLVQNTEVTTDEIKDYSKKMKEIIGQSISTIRQISRNLMPGVLTDFGLIAAITEFCNNLRQTGIIRINFVSDTKHYNLDTKTENIIYSVIKELINNTIKHADASEIELKISNTNKELKLHYTDNGIGFDLEKKANSGDPGLGIKNLLSKINALSGKVNILNNKGFGIEMTFPTNKN